MSTSEMTTPARSVGTRAAAGYLLLRDTGSLYRDGGEERVLQILQDCADVSSDSDEAFLQARDWPERYHVSPTRANIVRHLNLPTSAKVLEIGAGCGAVTRYLGETCAVVDALEPVPSRAAAARERCRDLVGVEILVGELDDIPTEPTYDVVVVIGVLEYVGLGTASRDPYLNFLKGIAARLRPNGSLVLAIENKLGVKYLAGAPEDHSGRVFDSLEGYPFGAPARTFSRVDLESLMRESGLTPTTGLAFPDYKIPRAIFRTDLLPADARSLLYRVPAFPSPDWMQQREHLADERLLWRSLVDAGLAAETGNSFLVVAGKGGPTDLWAESCAGAFYSVHRRQMFTVRTELLVQSGSVIMRRTSVHSQEDSEQDLILRTDDNVRYTPSRDLMEVFTDTDDEASVDLLRQWHRLVRESADGDVMPIDLVPHNLIVTDAGPVLAIDSEWYSRSMTADDVLARGAVLYALHLAQSGRVRAAWSGCEAFADVAQAIADVVGVGSSPGWLDRTIEVEAGIQCKVALDLWGQPESDRVLAVAKDIRVALSRNIHTPADFQDQQAVLRQAEHDLSLQLAVAKTQFTNYEQRLADERHAFKEAKEQLDAAHQQKLTAATVLAGLHQDISDLREQKALAQAELKAIQQTTSWQITKPLRALRNLRSNSRD